MSHRSRHSTVAATPARGTAGPGPSQRAPANELPPYQPLQHPLSTAGRDKLRHISQPHKFEANHLLLSEVISCLSEAAAETNEALSSKEQALERARAKASNDADSTRRVQDMEVAYEELQTKVDSMTAQMEKDVRKMIDADNAFTDMQKTLASLVNQNASTQRNTTQRTQRNGEDEYPDFDPTDPTNATQQPLSVATCFSERLARARDVYAATNMTQRYSKNNLYIGFKGVVHEARWSATEDNPLPPAHLWFKQDQPAAGETALGAAQDDSDDDLQIAKEHISTKCPLTLQEFRDPVTSRKCPHSFERAAITEMIDTAANQVRAEGGSRAVQCPVPGCQHLLTIADLHSDDRIKRKIARLQKNRRDEEDESDDDGNNAQSITSGDEDDDAMDVDDESAARRMKKERLSGRTPAPATQPRGRDAVLSLVDSDDE
jgi:hypothetical protein